MQQVQFAAGVWHYTNIKEKEPAALKSITMCLEQLPRMCRSSGVDGYFCTQVFFGNPSEGLPEEL